MRIALFAFLLIIITLTSCASRGRGLLWPLGSKAVPPPPVNTFREPGAMR